MNLKDINLSETEKIEKINNFLKDRFDTKVPKHVNMESLTELRENLLEAIEKEKLNGKVINEDASYSKLFPMLDAVNLIINERIDNTLETHANVIGLLLEYIVNAEIKDTDVISEAIEIVDSPYVDKQFIESCLDFFFEEIHLCNDSEIVSEDTENEDEDEEFNFSIYGPGPKELRDLADKVYKQRYGPGSAAAKSKPLTKKELEKISKERIKRYKKLRPSMFAKVKRTLGFESVNESYDINGIVKEMRFLVETEVNKAEVLIAAKSFSKELQKMVEKTGRLQNEELGPVIDRMREVYGIRIADAFQERVNWLLDNILEDLKLAQREITTSVINLARGEKLFRNDMETAKKPASVANASDNENGDVEGYEGDAAFSGPGDEPVTRKLKETVGTLKKKLDEARKQIQ